MHPADIQAALKKRGYSMADIGTALEVDRGAVYKVVHDKSRSRKIANAISKIIDKPVEEIWPDAYPDVYRRKRRAQNLMAFLSA